MITLLSNLPDNIVGAVASGRVTAADYETVLIPAIEAALKKHEKVRMLYELTADFTGFAPGAMWEDMKVGIAHLRAWQRVAVVTDASWVANAANLFKLIMPCPVKVFPLKDKAEAEAWIRI
ncbi:MAG TPA: STAS/SEC14 domain-containing protein [Tepidisphaeraceae bacterium]|jgi:hypothetical protein|nr:STAS/SEC14 domain-containing protein [Tepidisphaeraceae bacterium]